MISYSISNNFESYPHKISPFLRNLAENLNFGPFWDQKYPIFGPRCDYSSSQIYNNEFGILNLYFQGDLFCWNCIFTINEQFFRQTYHFLVIFDKIWTRFVPKFTIGPSLMAEIPKKILNNAWLLLWRLFI